MAILPWKIWQDGSRKELFRRKIVECFLGNIDAYQHIDGRTSQQPAIQSVIIGTGVANSAKSKRSRIFGSKMVNFNGGHKSRTIATE